MDNTLYTDQGTCAICKADVLWGKYPEGHDGSCDLGKLIDKYERITQSLREKIKNTPRTSARLGVILDSENTADAAIIVYKEALSEEKNLKELKTVAKHVAQMDMLEGGEHHHRNVMGGTAGWSTPKKKKLNVEKWDSLTKPKEVEDMMQRIRDARSLAADLTEKLIVIQEELDCFELPEPTFFIKS